MPDFNSDLTDRNYRHYMKERDKAGLVGVSFSRRTP